MICLPRSGLDPLRYPTAGTGYGNSQDSANLGGRDLRVDPRPAPPSATTARSQASGPRATRGTPGAKLRRPSDVAGAVRLVSDARRVHTAEAAGESVRIHASDVSVRILSDLTSRGRSGASARIRSHGFTRRASPRRQHRYRPPPLGRRLHRWWMPMSDQKIPNTKAKSSWRRTRVSVSTRSVQRSQSQSRSEKASA